MHAIIWSKEDCNFCRMAKDVLRAYNVEYEERVIGTDWTKQDLLEVVPNATTVPQIFINGYHIGGFTDLHSFLKSRY